MENTVNLNEAVSYLSSWRALCTWSSSVARGALQFTRGTETNIELAVRHTHFSTCIPAFTQTGNQGPCTDCEMKLQLHSERLDGM